MIVHINGPFKCGNHNDLSIVRSLIHRKLLPGEFYLADSGYRDLQGPSVLVEEIVNEAEKRHAYVTRARHETINRRFKEWKILHDIYRHSEHTHGSVFRAVAVLTQIDITEGRNIW